MIVCFFSILQHQHGAVAGSEGADGASIVYGKKTTVVTITEIIPQKIEKALV